MAGALAQLAVALQDLPTRGDEGDRDGRVVERALEAFLGCVAGFAHALALAPHDHVRDGECGHEATVDGRPLPRVVAVLEDGLGLHRAERAVLHDHEADGEQVGPPLLVQRKGADHHEVVEVRFGRAVPGDDECRGAGQQRRRAQRGADRGVQAPGARAGAEQRGGDVERPRRRERPALCDRERGQDHQVGGQHEEEPPMTGSPDFVR